MSKIYGRKNVFDLYLGIVLRWLPILNIWSPFLHISYTYENVANALTNLLMALAKLFIMVLRKISVFCIFLEVILSYACLNTKFLRQTPK